MDSSLKHLGLNCLNVLLRRALVGDFLINLSYFKAASALEVVNRVYRFEHVYTIIYVFRLFSLT
jgi:hypothetical protein